MSLSGISSSNLFNYENQSVQNKAQQIQQEFQQLGQDLQSGNLSAAQTDFTTLQQIGSNSSSTSSTASSNPLAQAFNQLGQDLQSGNLSAAQQDFTNIQQDLQSQASPARGHHHHHHGGGGGDQSNPLSQLFQQLGQALQSGSLSSAQQIYSAMQQDFAQLAASGQTSEPASGTATTGVSVSA
jgi:outer membrane protein assembly factor BamD (BamD/ComL family)